jgi:hypothetical protein
MELCSALSATAQRMKRKSEELATVFLKYVSATATSFWRQPANHTVGNSGREKRNRKETTATRRNAELLLSGRSMISVFGPYGVGRFAPASQSILSGRRVRPANRA